MDAVEFIQNRVIDFQRERGLVGVIPPSLTTRAACRAENPVAGLRGIKVAAYGAFAHAAHARNGFLVWPASATVPIHVCSEHQESGTQFERNAAVLNAMANADTPDPTAHQHVVTVRVHRFELLALVLGKGSVHGRTSMKRWCTKSIAFMSFFATLEPRAPFGLPTPGRIHFNRRKLPLRR